MTRMGTFARIIEAIEAEGSAALVSLAKVEGSSPREPGAHMVVRPSLGFHGTIGGGALEWQALAAAGAALKAGRGPALRRSLALGPELAQCCGGRVEWRIETFDARDLDDLAALAAAEAQGPLETIARLSEDGRVAREPVGSRASARAGVAKRPAAPGSRPSAASSAASSCSAPAMSAGRWRWRSRPCPSR